MAVATTVTLAEPPSPADPVNASRQIESGEQLQEQSRDQAQEQSRDQAQEQSRLQVQQQSGNSQSDSGREMKGNQGQNASQGADPEVRNGPYGNKQNANKSGAGGGKR
jgi:hypothetical protein